MSRVLLGISGGVDSAVSAWILQRDGHDVVAVTLRFSDLEHESAKYRRAAEMCAKLGIEHHEVDARDRYRTEVLERFATAHEMGLNPDPFVLQNECIVLPMLRELAAEYTCEKVATGHYASIGNTPDGPGILPLQLTIPLDKYHDQTYYLGTLTQEDLATTLFPLWDTSKPVAHVMAMRAGLMIAEFEERPQVGFLSGVEKAVWLEEEGHIVAAQGDIVHVMTQQTLGVHEGLHRYDLGTLVAEVSGAGDEQLFVVAKDTVGNRLYVGPRALCGAEQCMVADVNWVSIEAPQQKRSCKARYSAERKPVPVQVVPTKQGVLVTFNERVEGLVPGDPIVFYSDKLVLGGGKVVG